MKILVISDSHGDELSFDRAVSMHPDAEYVLFLGDGHTELERVEKYHKDKIFYGVRGNNDFYTDLPNHKLLELEGHRILMTHGHTQQVKYGLSYLVQTARMNGADIVLFGHTHTYHEEYDSERNIYLFNPGTVGAPCGEVRSYGILTVDSKSVLFSKGEIRK